jgi:transcriptional regulator with XRE-family HTH domain
MVGTRNSSPAAAHSLIAEAFGDVLEGARRRRDLGPDEVAARAGISTAHLLRIEHAQVNPRLDVLFRVADALGVSRTGLLDEVIDWLVPHANPGHTGAVRAQCSEQESRFIHQLICATRASAGRQS